ncbi:putative electron transfer flavoprotein beta subunit [Escherichia coli]|uniref:Putative electron transfer flavoprotein beta subunit n=1 Tax=Escherichia coli TaxID=562 RepID=A0A377DTA1_ECOLX|nr:putative electron transfer flavoprotein beta subunit [Escherichia coli]
MNMHCLSIPAKALAAAIEKIGFDLLIFGEGSGDLYAQQVGLLVGEILQLPVINAVSAIQRQGNTLVIERTLEDDVEVMNSLFQPCSASPPILTCHAFLR